MCEIDRIEVKDIHQGDYVVAFDTWKDPYRLPNGNIEYETCLEMVVGKVQNSERLTFSEALSLNTYQGSLNFLDSNFFPNISTKCLILIDEIAYNDIKEESGFDKWVNNPSYNSEVIFDFIQNVQTHLLSKASNTSSEQQTEMTEEQTRANL